MGPGAGDSDRGRFSADILCLAGVGGIEREGEAADRSKTLKKSGTFGGVLKSGGEIRSEPCVSERF